MESRGDVDDSLVSLKIKINQSLAQVARIMLGLKKEVSELAEKNSAQFAALEERIAAHNRKTGQRL